MRVGTPFSIAQEVGGNARLILPDERRIKTSESNIDGQACTSMLRVSKGRQLSGSRHCRRQQTATLVCVV